MYNVSRVLPVSDLFYPNRFETYDLKNIDLRFKTDLVFACKLIRGFADMDPRTIVDFSLNSTNTRMNGFEVTFSRRRRWPKVFQF